MDEFRTISAREDYSDEPLGPVSTLSPSPGPRESPPAVRQQVGPRLNRLLFLLGLVLTSYVLAYALPWIIQRIQYASTIGKERAKVEVALEGLAELDRLSLKGLSEASRLVAQRVGPSVVHIQTRRPLGSGGGDEWSFLVPGGRAVEGQGSGVIVDEEGYVVTNHHVIVGADDIWVNLSDGRHVRATVVGADVLTDIAVLKIDEDNLIAIPWGDSDALEVGDLVWAVGSPFGLDKSVTFGIISAKHRDGASGPHQSFLQSDAAVNPGNSGGPLVNSAGRVIGINTAIIGKSYQGISFSIPSLLAQDVYEKLRTNGAVARGWLGVRLLELSPELADRLKLEVTSGVLVAERGVVPGSPAARAGILSRDVVIAWNGVPVEDAGTLSRLVAATKIGSTARIQIVRDGVELELEVEVDQRPAELQ
jgi:S1-C subfamily serine protease